MRKPIVKRQRLIGSSSLIGKPQLNASVDPVDAPDAPDILFGIRPVGRIPLSSYTSDKHRRLAESTGSALAGKRTDFGVGHGRAVHVPCAVDRMHTVGPNSFHWKLLVRKLMNDIGRFLEEAGLYVAFSQRE